MSSMGRTTVFALPFSLHWISRLKYHSHLLRFIVDRIDRRPFTHRCVSVSYYVDYNYPSVGVDHRERSENGFEILIWYEHRSRYDVRDFCNSSFHRGHINNHMRGFMLQASIMVADVMEHGDTSHVIRHIKAHLCFTRSKARALPTSFYNTATLFMPSSPDLTPQNIHYAKWAHFNDIIIILIM